MSEKFSHYCTALHSSYWPVLDESSTSKLLNSRHTDGPERVRALSFVIIGESLEPHTTHPRHDTTAAQCCSAKRTATSFPRFSQHLLWKFGASRPHTGIDTVGNHSSFTSKRGAAATKSVFPNHRRHDEAPSAGRATTAHELGRHGYTSQP